MKTTTLSLASLLCVSLSHAGNNDLNKNVLSTPCGSFGTMKVEGQTNSDVNGRSSSGSSANMQYKHSSFKTSDGGTATFVKFNTNPTKYTSDKVTKFKDISKTINKEDIFKMSIYPNPARNEINILIQDGNTQAQDEKYTVRIKNLVGQNIFEQRIEGKQSRVDVSKFAKGFFLVEVSTSDGKLCHTKKVVIQ